MSRKRRVTDPLWTIGFLNLILNFKAPAGIGDTLTARVEVLEVMPHKNRVRLKTTCQNQDGVVIVDGEALVSPPKPSKA